ncbi:hypothetical protein Q7P37_000098 [Cladosporium fusiforme]
MEKLVLRGIMYGADKIPDKWFERVPGGYFKEKEQERRDHRNDEKRRSKREKSHCRRYSDEFEDRKARYDDDEYYEYDRHARPTDRRRRHVRSRSSYDGSNDFDPSHADKNHRNAARRRTYHEDDNRYANEDEFSRRGSSRRSYGPNGRPYDAPPIGGLNSPDNLSSNFKTNSIDSRNAAAAAAASAGTAAALSQQAQRSPIPPAAPVVAPIITGYVPYANIYGTSATQSPATCQAYPPPPPVSVASSIQPNSLNQVSPPPLPSDQFSKPSSASPYDPRAYAETSYSPSPRQQDPYTPPHSISPPRRARSERRPARNSERPSRANQGFVDPRKHMPPPTGPPSTSSGRRDDRRTSEWAHDQDTISRREARDRARRDAQADARGNRSE